MFERIYKHLKANGIDVFSVGQHKGDCLSPYVVVKPLGTTPFYDFSTTDNRYDLLCYVPREQFSQLEPFVVKVKNLMKQLEPTIKTTHNETPSYVDDLNNSHMRSVEYVCYKRF